MTRQDEVSKAREVAELSAAKELRAQREEAAELKAKLKVKETELDQVSEKLRSTTAELQGTTRERDKKQLEVRQTRERRCCEGRL